MVKNKKKSGLGIFILLVLLVAVGLIAGDYLNILSKIGVSHTAREVVNVNTENGTTEITQEHVPYVRANASTGGAA